jgi:2-dehydro-3-deoxyphosphogluconate aldolase / (4S)-4-hydroxy-2-oxoglutarate aldolase
MSEAKRPLGGQALAELARARILPILTVDEPGTAVAIGAALVAGGITAVEVTFRRPGAERAMAALAADPGLLVGAGTVLTPAQVDIAADAGARFVVSPGIDDDVLDRAAERGIDALPGVATATEIQRAVRRNMAAVKLFPVGPLGGVAFLTALASPFPAMRFVPTGGIGPAELADYLRVPVVLAVGGSWMVRPEWVQAGDWSAITTAARSARVVTDGVAEELG